MSRVGKKPIELKEGIKVSLEKGKVKISGPKGDHVVDFPSDKLDISKKENILHLSLKDKKSKNLHGLFRTLINNAVIGVSEGWSKNLELVGVGFRAQSAQDKLTLHLGFAHPVIIEAPENVSFKVKGNKITVSGIDKQSVGEIAAQIRKVKPPEPYKGKGIRYENERVRRKAGKAAKAMGAAQGG